MLSLNHKQVSQNKFIVRAVMLTVLVAALLLVFNFQSTAVTNSTPRISAELLNSLTGTSGEAVQVLITTESNDYTAVVQAIEAAGGTVTHQYKYATGLAAELPGDAVMSIGALAGVKQVQLDQIREIETGSTTSDAAGNVIPLGSDLETIDAAMRAGVAIPANMDGIETLSVDPADITNAEPSLYNVPDAMDAPGVWAGGNTGQDTLAVVIDTGIYSDHFMLAPNAIGGVDLSTDVGTPFEGWNLASNHWHGTHVSGIIAGHGALILPNASLLAQSVEYHTGQALPPYDAANKLLYLFGNAPDTQLYGIKVFPHTGAGAPTSTIIAGIEHAIDLKVVDGMDVDIINMSLGGGTGFEGRDLESQAVDAATAADITVVVSAGNDGPASLMIGSPAGANTAVTVAAAATAINSRVFWDNNFGILGIGDVLYTTNDNQVIYFSSRGPTSDGRMKPETMGIGTYVLSSFNTAAAPQSVAWASGTSMSAPSVAGVVSLLNTYGETVAASPADYKEAVVAGSSPVPFYDEYDQGAGLVSATAALAALEADEYYGSTQAPLSSSYSNSAAMPKGTYISPAQLAAGYTIEVEDLAPGHTLDFWTKVRTGREKFTIDVSNVDLGVDPVAFNSFEFNVSSAVRTTDCCYYLYSVNIFGDAQFTIEDGSTTASGDIFGVNAANFPMMQGYMRIVIENDWTTYDNMSGTFVISMENNPRVRQDEFYHDTINTGDSEVIEVGFGSAGVELDLSWRNNWSHYSTSDLDMVVVWYDTDGGEHTVFDGATFSSPEKARIEADNIDAVYVIVDGFETYGFNDAWKLKVYHLEED